jgi:hypothetical protein
MPRESKCITQRHPIHKQELKFKQNKIEKVKTCENPEAIEQKDFFFFHILILVFALAGKKEKKKCPESQNVSPNASLFHLPPMN